MYVQVTDVGVYVHREPGDPKYRPDRHSTFMHHVCLAMKRDGYDCVKRRACLDGVLVPYAMYHIRSKARDWAVYDMRHDTGDAVRLLNTTGQCLLYAAGYVRKGNEDGAGS